MLKRHMIRHEPRGIGLPNQTLPFFARCHLITFARPKMIQLANYFVPELPELPVVLDLDFVSVLLVLEPPELPDMVLVFG